MVLSVQIVVKTLWARSGSQLLGQSVPRSQDTKLPTDFGPYGARMIVYCGRFLDQSLRHHGARVQALTLAVKMLTEIIRASDGKPEKQK